MTLAVGILGTVSSLLDKLIPNRDAREKASHELELLLASGELELLLKQLEINKEEAKHSSIFVAGWRPFLGWACTSIFIYHYLLYPILASSAALSGADISHLPEFDLSALLTVLLGLLGLGGFRTFEKIKGVERNKI